MKLKSKRMADATVSGMGGKRFTSCDVCEFIQSIEYISTFFYRLLLTSSNQIVDMLFTYRC